MSRAETPAQPDPGAPPFFAAASDRLRESARWLVVTFGAIVAVVFAGVGVSRLDQLTTTTMPFWVAVLGALVALAGSLAALGVSISLAAASTVSVADVRAGGADRLDPAIQGVLALDPLLAPWDGRLAAFFDEVAAAQVDHDSEMRLWREDRGLDAARQLLDRSAVRLGWLSQVQASVLATASFLQLSRRFTRARAQLAGSLLVAAVGALAFVWATSTATMAHLPQQVRSATWRVPLADRADVADAIGGEACATDLRQVPVLVLGPAAADDELAIVTVPGTGCDAVRLTVSSQDVVGS